MNRKLYIGDGCMPAYTTHYLFAKESIPAIPVSDGFKLYADAVIFGTQGPDIFFFHRALPTMKGKNSQEIGFHMHVKTKPSVLFDAMRDFARQDDCEDRDIALSYIYGFLCHYALDRNVHPFVFSRQMMYNRRTPDWNDMCWHHYIEYGLDTLLLHDRMDVKIPRRFKTQDTVPTDETIMRAVGRVLEYVVPKATPYAFTMEQGVQACRDMRRVERFLCDRSLLKRPTAEFLELFIRRKIGGKYASSMFRQNYRQAAEYDYPNEKHETWYSSAQPDQARTESFYDLYDAAKEDIVNLIRGFNECLQTGASTVGVVMEMPFAER